MDTAIQALLASIVGASRGWHFAWTNHVKFNSQINRSAFPTAARHGVHVSVGLLVRGAGSNARVCSHYV